jgi:hypothetical protein
MSGIADEVGRREPVHLLGCVVIVVIDFVAGQPIHVAVGAPITLPQTSPLSNTWPKT